ncbi:hypothetical protein M3A49_21760 [Paraburkholderia sp. CNPSo 3076]|uniref:hypothetical protein n=1 Tax=Paraburkholderia sp. CNPSo 3076 TaxID=2940936 RepID=UPI00225403DD|nr:hypothetical protein [Paraburkholderia sp. CNPSo 3076]MCX5542104.1 hypothetical protein [Paraburkholderia sp. CNPSo 3076]
MPKAASKPRPTQTSVSARLKDVIGSAAGAIMRAEGIDQVLDAPDEVVGAKLKKEVKWLRRKLSLDRKPPKGKPTVQSA